jgi:hypothetical protein
MPMEQVKSFEKNTPLGRAGQPAKLYAGSSRVVTRVQIW